MNASLFHKLTGENIFFKPLNTEDAPAIHSYASDEDVSRFIGWNLMKTLDETKAYVEEMIRREEAGTHLYASIVLKSTNQIIGTAMIFGFDHAARHAEIGYVFHKDFWGKGFGTELVAMINDFAFETLKLHKLHARVVSANVGSSRVLERNGYIQEGCLEDYYLIDGVYHDQLLFGKIAAK